MCLVWRRKRRGATPGSVLDLHLLGWRLGSCGPRAQPALTPGVPPAGPFISVVLSKLENMLENSLHVNLLLIGIITQLASYPQPLLLSFLLNTNMVFQPSVRSLYQVCELSPRPPSLWILGMLMSRAPPLLPQLFCCF